MAFLAPTVAPLTPAGLAGLSLPSSTAETTRLLDRNRRGHLRQWKRACELGNRDELAEILAHEAETERAILLRELPADVLPDLQRMMRRHMSAARETSDRLRELSALGLSLSASDDEVRDLAEKRAASVRALCATGLNILPAALLRWAERRGITLPLVGMGGVTEQGLVTRLMSPAFWQRQLWKSLLRTAETQRIHLGRVSGRREAYVSDAHLALHRQRKRRSVAALEQAVIRSDEGDELSMAEVWEASVANPANRRAELMVRIKGMETIAQGVGHMGLFLTITSPSRYHPTRNGGREANPKWVEAGRPSPKQAAAYLGETWAKIRASLAREGVTYYGLRIAEPHADSCPHWHVLLFCPASQVTPLLSIAGRYVCEVDADEIAGREQVRFKAVTIDWSRGSAAGYCAKYVCKNVDGLTATSTALQDADDETGLPFNETAERVQAWASLWRIRQFQTLGGPPVGLWRELRRLPADEHGQYSVNAQIDAAARAADAGDWAEFCRVTGGMAMRRALRPVQLLKVETDGLNVTVQPPHL